MPGSDLTPDELLTTTRAVRRRLDLDRPVEPTLIRECVEVALQAPSASNEQGWHFVVVTDAGLRSEIAARYRSAWHAYRSSPGFSAFDGLDDPEADPARRAVQERMVDGVDHLARRLASVPVHVIPCVKGRVESVPAPYAVVTQASTYGSILPAVWSFMLAARARGLGTSFTTLHLFHEDEIADLLGIPHADYTQVALLPVAHTIGTDFKPGPRRPVDEVIHLDGW